MAGNTDVLASSALELPEEMANEVFVKAQHGSIVGNLVGAQPMKFGEVKYMTFDERPRAEYVEEAGQKSPAGARFGHVVAKPHKAQVTVRVNEEFVWADEDSQLEVLDMVKNACGDALARALDLGVFHGINPLTGSAASSIRDRIFDTTLSVEANGKIDIEMESAVKLILAKDYIPNGVALDPTVAYDLATMRDQQGRKLYPDINLTTTPSTYGGLSISVSNTVSGQPEISEDSKVRGIVGYWDALRWGVQRNIPLSLIEYGDPDGRGDLKRHNQVALRAEMVYGWGIMDKNAFATIKAA